MWQSLIRSDLEGIKQSSKALGVEEMYGLLACILTARSWNVITTGIDQGPVTDDEVCNSGLSSVVAGRHIMSAGGVGF